MTYGWAILIIAVVLGALFQLGVFNANNFAPKAPPGSCQVFRPNGPGTTSFINLEGVCSGELPQYVAQFNGANAYVGIPTTNFPIGTSPVTLEAWVYENNLASRYYVVGYGGSSSDTEFRMSVNEFSPGQFSLELCGDGWTSSAALSAKNWYNLVITYNGVGSPSFYVNGINYPVIATWGSPSVNTILGGGSIGDRGSCGGVSTSMDL